MSKFFRNVRKCVCTARNDSYTIQYHKYIPTVHQCTHNVNIQVHSGFLEGIQHPEKCTNSSEMSVNVFIQLEITHILSSTTNISLLYTSVLQLSIYRYTLGFQRVYNEQKMSKFIRNVHKCARNDSYSIQYKKQSKLRITKQISQSVI